MSIAPSLSSELVIRCRMALKLTQREFGDLMGKTKRTVQRWEDGGVLLLPQELKTIVDAVRVVDAELADQVLEQDKASGPRSNDAIAAMLQAASQAAGMSPESIRPAVTAAFEQAHADGLTVALVLAYLRSTG